MKSCILITYQFPFKITEPFLENEIAILASNFDKVYIFPVDITGDEKQTRKTPDNVVIVKPYIPRQGSLYYIKRWKNKFTSEYKKYNSNPLKIVSNLYFCGRTNVLLDQLINVMKPYEKELNNVVIYSYWNTYVSLVGIEYSKYLKGSGINTKVISRCHGYDTYSFTNALNYIPYQKYSIESLDALFPCSQNGVDYLNNKYGYHPNIKLGRLSTTDRGLNTYQTGRVIFVTCARFVKIKRHKLIFKAFNLLAKTNPNFLWVSFGDGKEFKKIESLVKKSNLTNNVILNGWVQNTKVLEYYKNNPVSYFLNLSTTEGAPVSIMEAQSFGIPCVATDVGGTSELVNDLNGVLLNKKITYKELCSILTNLMNLSEEEYLKKRGLSRKDWENLSSLNNYKKFIDDINNL